LTQDRSQLLQRIRLITPATFEETCLDVFAYQAAHNPLYAHFLALLKCRTDKIQRISEIPFLPISFFKSHTLQSGSWLLETEFSSSATTGQIPSRHLVRSLDFYLENTRQGFSLFYGNPADWCVLALLPSYLERSGSSLVAMADDWIKRSKYPESGFFLHDFEVLAERIRYCQAQKIPTLLLGVSFALLDFAADYPMDLQGITVMETGGMKGRRREITRAELHETLKNAFNLPQIHSEYGMTELLSQAYLSKGERFYPAPTMQVHTTEINDPFAWVPFGRPGVLNIIDLANVDTLSFIATEDLGRVYDDGSFEVIGRLDVAERRGCNLMVE
jgi:hypothetical protein